MSQRKKPAIRITAFKTSDIVLGTVDGFPPWPGEIVDPAMAPDAIKQKKKKNRFVNKSTELVRFFPGGEYAWLSPTRVTQLSVTQIEEFVANSGHKKPQLVNGYRKYQSRPAAGLGWYAHAMLGVVEEGLGHRIGNVTPKIEGSTPLRMVLQHVGEDPRAFGHATLRGDGDAVLGFLRSQCPEQSQDICYMRLVLEEVAKSLVGQI
ncbi:hypothetical protein B0H13DRAFT_2306683 [Mycena leptocephala]|nr:hypothetical protein B0H13DRAFT_2306683 [Mycena leptocephala]